MKKIIFYFLFFITFSAFSQGNGNGGGNTSNQSEITQLSNGLYAKSNEVIVRFNHKLLDPEVCDDVNINYGQVKDFFHYLGKEQLKEVKKALKFDLALLEARKIFRDLKTCDIVSMARTGEKIDIPPFWATLKLRIPNGFSIEQVIEELKKAYPVVIYAEPNYLFSKTNELPNDNYFNTNQHSLNSVTYPDAHINIDSAWTMETGKKHIKVGIFDTGIDRSHEDLEVLQIVDMLYTDTTYSLDYNGHGTAVAGIIGAKRNNGVGVSGVAGGDGSATTGVSLLDFHTDFNEEYIDFETYANMIINAARSTNSPLCDGKQGQGIHVANHSYQFFYILDQIIDTVIWNPPPIIEDCFLCYEAQLFSLKNGVVNVVARGNIHTYDANQYNPTTSYPQNYPDEWVISVGSSGTDGNRSFGSVNGIEANFTSPVGQNIDLLAPGTASLVYTTKSKYHGDSTIRYRAFNGTSASAPHVTGVASLLLSYYNIANCYSNTNLDPADVEHILQKSAKDLYRVGYDDSSGWGRLDAYKALKLIEYPKYQVVHPNAEPTAIEILEHDTIFFKLNRDINKQFEVGGDPGPGPLNVNFPLQVRKFYDAERFKYKLTYNFKEPYFSDSTTKLLDVWLRHGQTNSLKLTNDTTGAWVLNGTTGSYHWVTSYSIFDHDPSAEIVNVDTINKTIELTGYYYHFIKKTDIENLSQIAQVPNTYPENLWYPINPNEELPKMAFSVHLYGANLTQRFAFPCDSVNNMISHVTVDELEKMVFSLYPNPSMEELNVLFDKIPETNSELIITDMQGKILLNQKITDKNNLFLNTKNLDSGIYFVSLRKDNNIKSTQKWIKL